MKIEQIVEKFMKYPKALDNGAGSLSRRWNCTREEIYEARKIARNKLKYGTEYSPKDVIIKPKNFPKILLFDIETSPSISYTFGRFKYNIAYDQVEQEPIMLSWSAKLLYSTEMMSDKITKEEVLNEDDSRIVKSLWKLMDEADIVVAHYGDGFDIPMLNTRAILNGLPPYNTVRSIDTKKIASTVFKFPSNKLDALAKYFEIPGKIKTEFSLWIKCLKGDEEAIEEMRVYNMQDVEVLEAVYLKLRPYIKSHPNLAVYMDSDKQTCSACGSSNLTDTGKYQYTNTGKFKVYRCECGALSRGRRSDFDKSKTLLTSVPR